MSMKGVILAGGSGTRLHPLTRVTNKHLLPVYDRPMIYYPLDTLRDAGIEHALVIVGGRSVGDVVELLQDGSEFGLRIAYRYQPLALGISHAIGMAREFAGEDPILVILGDNILRGSLREFVERFLQSDAECGTVLTRVDDAHRFGVARFGDRGQIVGFDEKPQEPASDLIPIGVYLFRPSVFSVIDSLQPSGRGELEVTDLLNHYLKRGSLVHHVFTGTWADAGTIDSLLESGLERRTAGLTEARAVD
jgi:glucose-1-phosphate thymidylyltransferase